MAGWTGWMLMICIFLPLCAPQATCRGRCGEPFTRGQLCNCDYLCLTHGECCKDYESVCTSRNSCRGRCGETFQRGKGCECDPDCVLYNTCCSDYHGQCETASSSPTTRGGGKPKLTAASEIKSKEKPDVQPLRAAKKPSDSDSEERNKDYTDHNFGPSHAPTEHSPDAFTDGAVPSVLDSLSDLMPLTEDLPAPHDALHTPDSGLYPAALSPAGLAVNTPGAAGSGSGSGSLARPGTGSSSGKPLSIPIHVSLSIRGHAAGGPTQSLGGPVPAAGRPITLTDIAQALAAGGPTQALNGPVPAAGQPSILADIAQALAAGGPTQSLSGPVPAPGRPSTLTDIVQALAANNPATLPDEASNQDLCNGLPIDALTSLFNGSIIVFRGHFFWLLDLRTRTAGPAQNITEQLGVPSPIDTAFTRCNCQGKTYIVKGDSYWSFENGVMEPGYPRSVSADFGGLTGEISAALSVPATRKRPESIYFFKKGGTMQTLSYPAGSGPNCSGKKRKNSVYAQIRRARQAEIRLSGEININLNMKDFPTPVTSALSMPNSRKPEGFEYFIFSWPKFFSVKITGEFPSLMSPAKPPATLNQNIRNWLNCL